MCWEKSDDLSIAWDTIDVTVTPGPGVWLPAGLWIGNQARRLHIFKALDENGISSQFPAATTSTIGGPPCRTR